MRSRLSYWDIWSTKELFWRMKMGNQRRTSMHAERCKPAHWDSWSGAPRHHNLLDLPALMWAEWCSGSHKVPEVEVYGMAVDERCPMHGCMLIWGHDVSVPTVLSRDAKEGLDSVSCWNLVLFPRCLQGGPLLPGAVQGATTSYNSTLCLPSSYFPKTQLIFLCPCSPKITQLGQQGISVKFHTGFRGLTGITKNDAFGRQKSVLISIKTESHQGKQESAIRHLQLVI